VKWRQAKALRMMSCDGIDSSPAVTEVSGGAGPSCGNRPRHGSVTETLASDAACGAYAAEVPFASLPCALSSASGHQVYACISWEDLEVSL